MVLCLGSGGQRRVRPHQARQRPRLRLPRREPSRGRPARAARRQDPRPPRPGRGGGPARPARHLGGAPQPPHPGPLRLPQGRARAAAAWEHRPRPRLRASVGAHRLDRKSTRLNSSHTNISTLSLHALLPTEHVHGVVKPLGRRDQGEAAGLLDQLAISAARHSHRTLVLSAFHKGELAPLRRGSIGPDLVFGRLWERTGCGPVLRRMAQDHGFAFDLERAVYASVLHRLMVSGSDRHAEAWTQHCRIPGAEHIGLRQLYKAIAWLGAEDEDGRPRTELIEEALFAHRRELFGQGSIAFFDTTSLWFEGQGGGLGRHGHSKDYRPDRKSTRLNSSHANISYAGFC